MNQEKEKGIRRKMDKLLLGVIVGGAVGSILGITFAPQSGKKTRQEIIKKTEEMGQKISGVMENIAQGKCSESAEKNGFWHILNRIFCRRKK